MRKLILVAVAGRPAGATAILPYVVGRGPCAKIQCFRRSSVRAPGLAKMPPTRIELVHAV